jgi:hypothetical protein
LAGIEFEEGAAEGGRLAKPQRHAIDPQRHAIDPNLPAIGHEEIRLRRQRWGRVRGSHNRQ